MSKYIKISQQTSPGQEKESKPEMSQLDQANLQKLKSGTLRMLFKSINP